MQFFKSLIFAPTLDEQRRECTNIMRTEIRALDRSISTQSAGEIKAKTTIQAAHRRTILFSSPKGTTTPRNTIAVEAAKQEMRTMARELVRLRRHTARLHTCKAQMASVQMQVNEAFAAKKIDSSMRQSTKVMNAVSGLVSMPELMKVAQSLSRELMKAGVIDEMTADTLAILDPDEYGEEDEIEEGEEESEVDRVLRDILKLPDTAVQQEERAGAMVLPDVPSPDERMPAVPLSVRPSNEDTRELVQAMRGRLDALKS